MNNQKELEKELEGLSYLPKTTEPKKDVLVNVDEKVDVDDTTKLSLKQRIAKVLEDFKKKGKKLSPKLKKWATSALAGSLVAAMLFLGSCANMKSMEQIYPRSVVQMLEDNGYTSQDYDTKKQEFLSEDADMLNLAPELQVVPEQYYIDKFGASAEEVNNRAFQSFACLTSDALLIGVKYYPSEEVLGEPKWTKVDNLYWRYNDQVLCTLFKYELDKTILNAIKNSKFPIDYIYNTKEITRQDKELYREQHKIVREDRGNNFQYRYLLDSICRTQTPIIMAESWGYNTSVYAKERIVDDFCKMRYNEQLGLYTGTYGDTCYGYFLGRKQNGKYDLCFLSGPKIKDEHFDDYEEIKGIPRLWWGAHSATSGLVVEEVVMLSHLTRELELRELNYLDPDPDTVTKNK